MNTRKQGMEHADFVELRRQAKRTITYRQITDKANRTADQITRFCAGKTAAFAWSGGKDSVVLGHVAGLCGISDCVLGITDLEYPAFLAWVTANMPARLEVHNVGLDLDWLAANERMLFPQDSAIAAAWFAKVQHAAQAKYYKQHKLDVLLVGRRRSDGNFVGRAGQDWYECGGITRYSPIADWSHADVFALIDHYNLPLPPFYQWPRGYRCGTHAWAARQWCKGIQHGWHEVNAIDPSVVRFAATRLRSAADYLSAA